MVNLFVFNNGTTDTSPVRKAEKRIFSFSCTENSFSESCAVNIVFYCNRNMKEFLENFFKLCACVIRDVAVGINNRTFIRIDLSGSTDTDGIKREILFRKTADSIQNVSTAPEGLGWVFFGFFEMSVLADSVFDRGTANVED